MTTVTRNKDKLSGIVESIAVLIDSGRLKAAEKKITKYEKQHPADHRLLFLQSALLESKQDYSNAEKKIIQAVGLSPGCRNYQFKLAQIFCRLEEFGKAKCTLMTLLDRDSSDIPALGLMAEVFGALNDQYGQLVTLLRLAGLQTLSLIQSRQVFNLMYLVKLEAYSEHAVKGLKNILDYKDINTRALAPCISRYIVWKYDLEKPPLTLLSEACSDRLLLKAIPLVRLCVPEVELFLVGLREYLLRKAIVENEISDSHIDLAGALSQHNYLNEYVGFINEEEDRLIQTAYELLREDLKSERWSPKSSEAILLLVSMYTGLYDTPFTEDFLRFDIGSWPASLVNVAQKTLFDIKEELDVSSTIPSLTHISNAVSKEVQAHYEQNPYPRWTKVRASALENLASFVLHSCPTAQQLPEAFYNKSTPILIAGSGTGMQPITTALWFPSAEVVAVDISRRSLAYAAIKAKEFGVDNIEFYHGDLLELPSSLGRFYYVECCGVLHHMQDPILGWSRLTDLLEPGGIAKIALYSEVARRDIIAEKNKISQLGLKPTAHNIRLYRKALMSQSEQSPIVKMFVDFYSLSECRDLLFHQHEKCFSWSDIKLACDELGLVFLGITDQNVIPSEYAIESKCAAAKSFEALNAMEQEYPYTFRSMYQFLVQKPH